MAASIGVNATQTFTVTDDDTAIAMGSGDVPVLGTPRMIAWCEAVTVTALGPELADGETSLGVRVGIDHLLPTPVGVEVEATATVSDVDGRQVTFSVVVVDPSGTAAKGSITRVVVDRDRFVSRATGG